ncbi:ABC transporter permease [Homoserinibacter sp. YIM 151385]|uniref:ABC transporter permease n=1 Tax=Homoserinibacter sp. YIM 151385 TaxID=2985506 RepID=UPI0022F130CA|nr:ABC transporter permease [Homoserinibacter sp. YIM 151385]WBU36717.1 ABC transporter permease [Homoserinibacter sp. YIM 151385]
MTSLPMRLSAIGVIGKRRARPVRRNATLAIGVGIIVALTAFALLGPVLSPYGTTQISDTPFAGSSTEHWLGTDNLGRDTFVRLAAATGYTLLISFTASVVAMAVGTALGVLAGYLGGWTDLVVMRGVEVFMSIPAILMALVVRVIFGPGVLPLVVAMAIVAAPMFARIMRGPILLLKERDFVVAAEVGGVGRLGIAFQHLLPNALTPMLVQFANTASLAVLLEASLSYLGQGVQAPEPSAGRMISEFQRYMADQPQLVLIPAALVTILTVGWNLISDGLQAGLSPRASQLQVPVRPRRPASSTSSTLPTTPASHPSAKEHHQ